MMSLVMPAAAAISSIDVCTKPARAKARAAARRSASRRSARGNRRRAPAAARTVLAIAVYAGVYTRTHAAATVGSEARMKFGVFYEHQVPRPWDPDAEYRALQSALEQCALADRLGIDYAWEAEHPFLRGYSHPDTHDVFMAEVPAR